MKFKGVLMYFINYSQNEYKATVKSILNQKKVLDFSFSVMKLPVSILWLQ